MDDWKSLKKECYGKQRVVQCEGGFIDFSKDGMKDVLRGEALSYDEYLEVQHNSLGHIKSWFGAAYFERDMVTFSGEIEAVKNGRVVLHRLLLDGITMEGDGCCGREDHVWMDIAGFEDFSPKDSVRFQADIYRYLKTGHGRMIDFALRNPDSIEKIKFYEQPTDEELQEQFLSQLVCETCLYHDHCYGVFCIMGEERRRKMVEVLKKAYEEYNKYKDKI